MTSPVDDSGDPDVATAPDTDTSSTTDTTATTDDASSSGPSDAATADQPSDAASSTDTAAPADDTSGAGQSDVATADQPADTSSTTADPGPPYLIIDVYSGDDGRLVGKAPNWQALAQADHFVGAILKAWDGTAFVDGGWFKRHWDAVKQAGGDRYGSTWFRGAYLFLEFLQDGAKQADAYLAAVDAAGGWDKGDIVPIIDVEQGGETHPNRKASAQQIVACTTACAERIKATLNRPVMLYGRGAMRDLSIVDKMGCDRVWNPAYTATMPMHGLEAWTLEDVVLWQYCGDGQAFTPNLPNNAPGFGPCDISVFVKGAQKPDINLVRDNLL